MINLQSDLQNCSHVVPQPSIRILNSWKGIASYLGRGVRTIQRYEQELGLPIHRPAPRERSSVMAFADEIEEWLRNAPSRNGTRSVPGVNSSLVIDLEEIQFNNDGRSELGRRKEEMERAHAEYLKTVQRCNDVKLRIEMGKEFSSDGKPKATKKRKTTN